MTYRVVVDTNLIISATFWGGQPRRLLDLIRVSKAQLVTSTDIIHELKITLQYSKFDQHFMALGRTVDNVVEEYQKIAESVTPADVPEDVVRDKKDRMILATAVGGKASHLVSGDKDLLDLREYEKIIILTATQFIEYLTKDQQA
jgi:putative PIN family toxin of toxin-antitoxin system